MASAVQVQYRRGTSSQVAAFTGAQGEMVVDTTNNRVVIQDGSTTGGWPAAKLSEVQTNIRTQVSDGNYAVQTTDRLIAYITLTASRVVSLPAASTYPSGSRLLVVDESGACSTTITITLSANGSDLIDGASSAVIDTAYGYLAVECNTANKWTIVDQVAGVGGTLNGLSGALTLAATDGSVISAAGTTVSIGGPGGFVNKFRNGTMDVWQRSTSMTVTSSGAYTADGWIVTPAGASVAVAQAGGRLLTKNSLQVTGATSVTDVQVAQRIESSIAAALCSQAVTVQAWVYNGTGGSMTPTLTVKRPSTQDGWSGTVNTDVNAANLQSCPASAWTRVAYTFSANAGSYNGLQITFDFGNNLGANTKSIQVAECDIRVTPGASTGINSNPPPPELRPIATELAFCQRYFFWNGGNNSAVFPVFNTSNVYGSVTFPVTMRVAPTVIIYNGTTANQALLIGGGTTTITAVGNISTSGVGSFQSSAGFSAPPQFNVWASAEL